jgi:hypothetical protein
MSYEFYQGQMSGELPSWNSLLYSKGGWKKSAHLKDGSPIGVDLVGGFYDAGGEWLWCLDQQQMHQDWMHSLP